MFQTQNNYTIYFVFHVLKLRLLKCWYISLSIYLSISLSIYLYTRIYIYIYIYIYAYTSISINLYYMLLLYIIIYDTYVKPVLARCSVRGLAISCRARPFFSSAWRQMSSEQTAMPPGRRRRRKAKRREAETQGPVLFAPRGCPATPASDPPGPAWAALLV